ncbi:MAG: UbiX family flavin prenyltransferase [Candidatus Thermoplasmatota archaeon]
MKVLVALTGASGSIYGIRLLEELNNSSNVETHMIASESAKKILEYETRYTYKDLKKIADDFYDNDDLFSPVSSGTYKIDAMVIVPCSMKTLSAVANGYSDTLISRSASCCLKENNKLVLVPRETPLALPYIKNMLKSYEAGAIVLPAIPGFYHKPKKIDDLVDFVVGKIFDQLGLNHDLFERWK